MRILLIFLCAALLLESAPAYSQQILIKPSQIQNQRPQQTQSPAQIYIERARRMERAGDYTHALSQWQQVLTIDPWDAAAINAIPDVLVVLKRYDDAESFLKDLLSKSDLAPQDPSRPTGPVSPFGLKLKLGSVLLAKGDEEGAWDAWNGALADMNNSPDAVRGLVNELQRARRWEESEALIRKYRTETHNPTFMALELASSLQAQMNFADATEELLLYTETSPTAWRIAASYMNRFPDDSTVVDRVMAVLKRAVRSDRKNGTLLQLYAGYALKAGLLDESMTATIEADPLTDSGGMLVLQASRAMLNEGAVDLARRGFEQVIAWKPPANTGIAEEAELGLGQCLEALGKYSEAADAYETFVTNHPQSRHIEEARYRIADILLDHEHNVPEALTMFKGIWIRGRGPEKITAGLRIGDCHAWMGEYDAAIDSWEEVVALGRKQVTEDAATALLRIARANFWRDSTALALGALDSITNGQTSNTAFNDAILYSALLNSGGFYRAVRAFADGDYDMFKKEPTDAAEKFSEAADMMKYGKMAEWSRFQQALALRDAGQPEAAIAALDTFITSYPESVDLDRAEYTQAVIRADDLHDLEGALNQFEKFLVEHPRSPYLEQARRKARIISREVS